MRLNQSCLKQRSKANEGICIANGVCCFNNEASGNGIKRVDKDRAIFNGEHAIAYSGIGYAFNKRIAQLAIWAV